MIIITIILILLHIVLLPLLLLVLCMIPTMFNFLGNDAIISTYLIQIAINNQYQEINQLFNITQIPNIEVKDLNLIFVVGRMEDVWDFSCLT